MAFPKLSHAFDLIIWGPPGFSTTRTKHSDLCVALVDGGTVTTPDGQHSLYVSAGTDWMTVSENTPTLSIDARVSAIDPSDGANLDFAYLGKMRMSDDVAKLFSGEKKETRHGEGYYYTTVRISSHAGKFAWVNETVFLAMGALRLNEKGRVEVHYRILKID